MANLSKRSDKCKLRPNYDLFSQGGCVSRGEAPLDKIGQSVKNEQAQSSSFDTLAYLPQNDDCTLHQSADSSFSLVDNLNKRAQKKIVGEFVNKSLSLYLKKNRPYSPIRKGVNFAAFVCSSSLTHNCEDGSVSTAFYCRQRWCPVCESIRMSQNATALKSAILREVEETGDEPYLVTLTLQNCLANKAAYERLLEFMREKVWKPLKTLARQLKKKGTLNFRGYYSVETTYNQYCYFKNGPYANTRQATFHPHFHFLVFSKREAEWLKAEWIKRVRKLADDFTGIEGASAWLINEKLSQDISAVDYSSEKKLLELTKYSVKGSSRKYDKKCKRYVEKSYPARVRADLFEAHHKKRLFNCFGGFSLAVPKNEDLDENLLVRKVKAPNNLGSDVGFIWNYHTKTYVPLFEKVAYTTISLTENWDKYIMRRFGLSSKPFENKKDKDALYLAQGQGKGAYSRGWFDGLYEDSDVPLSREFEEEQRRLRFNHPQIILASRSIRNAETNEKPPEALMKYLEGIGWSPA
jgi:hypothetical protein